MPQPFLVTPYSKRSVFVTEAEDAPTLAWMTKALHHLGATRTKSVEQPGWIMPKDQEDAFRAQYRVFKRAQGGPRGRHSRDPDEKHRRSRGRPGGSMETSARVQKSGKSTLGEALKTSDHIRDEKVPAKGSDSAVSYIDWDEVDAAAADLGISEDEKRGSHSSDSRSRSRSSDEESSDDEMIQTVLARKMKSESSGKHIEEESIPDSDQEDCVSYSRRLRHVYIELAKMREKIAELERRLVS